jgi:ABC-type antimicrobial peptide transport system permease subunit
VTNIEIVGVVKDFNRRNLREQMEQAFFLYWDRNSSGGVFYLSVRGDPDAVIASVRSAVARIDPAIPVTSPTTFAEQMDRSLSTERMLAALSTAFGVIALLLTAVGLYGVMSFVVTRRTRELGLRSALGATRAGVVRLILREALLMVSVGTLIALAAVVALSRVVEAHLFGVHATDAATIVLSTALLAVVALVAAMRPAWRAASVSPMQALRSD